jgi:hypothetical protein
MSCVVDDAWGELHSVQGTWPGVGSRPKPLKPTKLHPRAPVGACHCCARQFLKIHPVMGTLSMCKSIAACAVLHALTQGYATVCGALVARTATITANSYYYGTYLYLVNYLGAPMAVVLDERKPLRESILWQLQVSARMGGPSRHTE